MSRTYDEYIKRGIIEPAELAQLIEGGAPDLKIIDASFYLPTSDQDSQQNYLNKHISGALYFDIKAIADKNSALPHMLPNAEEFESALCEMGVANTDTIVIYGQTGILMGPARVWWMMRAFGHSAVCVLNGGLPAWEAEGYATTNEARPGLPVSNYKADFKPALVRNMDDVLAALETPDLKILDARPAERYSGAAPEPRAGMRSGHIPGSINIPGSSLVDSKSGKLKPTEQIQGLFDENGISNDFSIIASCGSGITACALALAAYSAGRPDITVYDGSWSEWGHENSPTPVEKL